MTAQTKHPQMPPANLEARPASQTPALPKDAETAGPPVYWGDRLALKFWLFCFTLMASMHLVEALHRLILFLLGSSRSP